MRRHHLVAAGVAVLLFAATASAAFMDARKDQLSGESGYWVVENTNDSFPITLYADPETGDPFVTLIDLYLRVEDGSSGPEITSIDLIGTGTFGSQWGDPAQGPFRDDPPFYSPQDVYRNANDDDLTGAELESGDMLAYVTVDATGVTPGDYDLLFQGGQGDSMFFDPDLEEFASMNYRSGVIRVTEGGVIPEPSAVVLLSGLLGSGGVGLLLRRRRKRAAK